MIKLRDFRPGDLEKICEFKRKSVPINFPGSTFNEALFRKKLLARIRRTPEFVKVAESDGEVAGYITFRVISATTGIFGRIVHIFVDENFRNKGIGRVLIQAAEEQLKKAGIGKIKLEVTKSNDAALSLYGEMGYKTTRFVMEKNL